LSVGLRYNNNADGVGAQTSRPCQAGSVSYLLGGTTLTGYFFANYQLSICGFERNNKLAKAPHFLWAEVSPDPLYRFSLGTTSFPL